MAAILGADVHDDSWLTEIRPRRPIRPGTATADVMRVPVKDAQAILRRTVRLVADLPTDTSGIVVWSLGGSELLVDTADIGMSCDHGAVTIAVHVSCDQLPDGGTVTVPFAVGTAEAPAGLVMSTFARPSGPDLVLAIWAEAVTAFAWEALLHLGQQLAGQVGADTNNRPLVPAAIGAERDLLIVHPMARHTLWAAR